MIDVGPFFICGEHDPAPTPAGKTRIVLPPMPHAAVDGVLSGAVLEGMGYEPFTQVGLLAVAQHMQPGMSFLEVGAGTSILSVAAMLLGASKAYAVDTNPHAGAYTQAFAAANGVAVEAVEGTYGDWRGDKERIRHDRIGQRPPRHHEDRYRDYLEREARFEAWHRDADGHVQRHNAAVAKIPRVDLAIISISTDYASQNAKHIKAKKILFVSDEYEVREA